ncbi:MAG: VOC family protein [Microbacteriaceae bacterium]|nr:VOC family protein [Microbacteriaceae bacterium]
MTSSLGPLWHVGIVVRDIDTAMTELSASHGHKWTTVQDQEVSVLVGGERQNSRVRWAASSGESPDWEIIESRAGIWSLDHNNGQALHHIAYWSDDLESDVARLERLGYRVEASGTDTDNRLRFAYLISPSGIRIEFGATYTREAWDDWITGGEYGLGIS